MMLMIWSIAQYMNEVSIRSTIGRMPTIAAPAAAPVNAASVIGVLRTRSGPNSSTNPSVEPSMFHATSSPMMNTRSSRRISSSCASRTACR